MRKDDFQLIETMVLYSGKCINYLQQAIENAELTCEDEFRRFYEDANLETWESDDEGKNETSSDEDEEKNDSNCNEDIKKVENEKALNAQRNPKILPLNEEQKESLIRKLGMPPSTLLTLPQSTNCAIEIPLSLISKEQRMSNALIQSKAYHSLATEMAVTKKPTFILLLQSGRFAASVFLGSQCLHHTTSTRYTVRKGQGRAQNAQDGKRKPKSVGSQLRRAGEEALRKDVYNFLLHNKSHLENACLILMSIPKVMVKNFFNDCSQFLSREDNRIRKIPLDLGRPTFEAVVAAYEIMMKVNIVRKNEDHQYIAKIDDELQESHPLPQVREESEESNSVSQISIPMSPVHVFAAEGNLVGLMQIMTDEFKYDINLRAGDDFMTPLHMASASSQHNDPNMSAACVSALLIHGRANPCLLDARFRVPYYLASHDKVREAFRLARGELGEEYCDWEEAKVGPALTRDALNAKKMKAAEKKRRQRAKQKEKIQKEIAIKEETEKNRQEENERMKREIEAKRLRDGLQPMTSTATNICDFCQQQCKGKSRRQMLQRLSYAYCSTQCVQDHKRELLAAAALARFN